MKKLNNPIVLVVLVMAALAGRHLELGAGIELHGILGNIVFTLAVTSRLLDPAWFGVRLPEDCSIPGLDRYEDVVVPGRESVVEGAAPPEGFTFLGTVTQGLQGQNPLKLKKVHHVEFWTGNAKQSSYFYRKAFGFSQLAYSGLETGNRDVASYVLSQGKIRFVISTDAHSTGQLRNTQFGVTMARRGGVRRGELLNALPAQAFVDAVRPARR